MFIMKFSIITLIFLFGITHTTVAQKLELNDDYNKKNWQLNITPYGLLAFNSTDVGGTRIRQSFGDLASITNAGFQLAAHARYKRLHLFFDGTWAVLGEKPDSSNKILNLDLEVVQNILAFKFGYTAFEDFSFQEDEILSGWSLTPTIGTKYWKNDINLKYTLSFDDQILDSDKINKGLAWWDLMIGVNTNFYISKKFMLSVGLDVGGFGIGNASKFAYDFVYMNSFKVSELITVNAGFRNFMYRKSDATPDGNLDTKVNVLGPVIGASFTLL